jgi:hypothetical protein
MFTMQSQCVLNQSSNQDAHLVIILVQDKNTSLKLTVGCNRAAVSRNRYGIEKTVDTHKILINAIKFLIMLFK